MTSLNKTIAQEVDQIGLPREMPDADDDFIDIGRIFLTIRRHKWGIAGLALAITLLTGLIVFSMQPVYRASASVMLESVETNLVGVEDVYSASGSQTYLINTQFDILKSRDLAERVVRKLQLHKHPIFTADLEASAEEGQTPWYHFELGSRLWTDLKSTLPPELKTLLAIDFKALLTGSDGEVPPPPPTEEEQQEILVQAITGKIASELKVTPVQLSLMANLSFESTSPRLAANIVNAVAREFINGDLEVRMSGTVQATDWLNERLEDLKIKLSQSEQALQDFRDREGLVDVEGVTGLGNRELEGLSQRLDDARRARIEAQNIVEEVRNMRNASVEELMSLPAVLQYELIGDLKREQSGIERKVAELGKRYGYKHPKMIAAQSDLNTANQELALAVRKVVSGINREYELARRNERELEATWEESKTEVQEFNRTEFRLKELQREVDTHRQLYDVFFTRIKGVSETGGFEKPHARIIDKAIPPAVPVKPNKRLSLILALVLGTMLGCGIAVLLDMLDNTVKSPDDVQGKLGYPLLGTVPLMKQNRKGQIEQYWEKPQGQFAEAVRTIRTGVVLSSLDNPAKIIVVTSTIPGEGKSTLALNLGAALGQMENTLVIGGDLRRPGLAKKCGLTPNHPGLSHFVSGTAKLKECIEYLEAEKIYLMPPGVIPPNPLEMLSSKKFSTALKFLRERFDRIVIDSAPVQPVSDAVVLASYADSVVYVVKADSTSATQVQKGIASILASNEPLTGIVLNQFDAKNASKYEYGNKYYQYNDYYQSEDPAKA